MGHGGNYDFFEDLHNSVDVFRQLFAPSSVDGETSQPIANYASPLKAVGDTITPFFSPQGACVKACALDQIAQSMQEITTVVNRMTHTIHLAEYCMLAVTIVLCLCLIICTVCVCVALRARFCDLGKPKKYMTTVATIEKEYAEPTYHTLEKKTLPADICNSDRY